MVCPECNDEGWVSKGSAEVHGHTITLTDTCTCPIGQEMERQITLALESEVDDEDCGSL